MFARCNNFLAALRIVFCFSRPVSNRGPFDLWLGGPFRLVFVYSSIALALQRMIVTINLRTPLRAIWTSRGPDELLITSLNSVRFLVGRLFTYVTTSLLLTPARSAASPGFTWYTNTPLLFVLRSFIPIGAASFCRAAGAGRTPCGVLPRWLCDPGCGPRLFCETLFPCDCGLFWILARAISSGILSRSMSLKRSSITWNTSLPTALL
jgi:hypothetical protein